MQRAIMMKKKLKDKKCNYCIKDISNGIPGWRKDGRQYRRDDFIFLLRYA